MKLYSWNVNGIRAVLNKGTFQAFMEEHQPDILCLQEVKAKEEQANLELSGYHIYWNSAAKAGYSGTAIITKKKPLNVWYDFPEDIIKKHDVTGDLYGDANKEGRVIAVEYEDFIVATVYTPNSKGDLSRLELRHKHWDKAWLEYMKRLQEIKPVLFSGDLNVAHAEDDLARPKDNRGKHGFTDEEREGFSNFLTAGFIDTFRIFTQGNGHYSWWTHWAKARERNVGWRIDYWIASSALKDRITDAKIHPDVMGSDHCPVSVTIK